MNAENTPLPEPEPPRPEKLCVDWHEDGREILYTKNRDDGRFFFIIWMAGWSVGAFALAYQAIINPALVVFGFGIPMWASWLLGACWLIWCWFGKETLLLNSDGVLFQQTAFIPLIRRDIPLREIRYFREFRKELSDDYKMGIELQTLGKPLQFGFHLPDEERAWVVHRFNRYLEGQGALDLPEPQVAVETQAVMEEQWPEEPEPPVLAPEPARPEKLTVYYGEDADSITLIKRPQGGMGCLVLFLLILQIPLTLLALLFTLGTIMAWSTEFIGMALLFWFLSLPGGAITAYRLFGRQIVRLTPGGLSIRRKVLATLSKKFIPMERILNFEERVSDNSSRDYQRWDIEVNTSGLDHHFMRNLPFRERLWIVYQLNRFLTEQPNRHIEHDISLTGNMTSDSEVLWLENTHDAPPSDSVWERTEERNKPVFQIRGRFNPRSVIQWLFINTFANGIIVFFLLIAWGFIPEMEPEENEPILWVMRVFLIPFIWIGLIIAGNLLRALAEPWRRTTWRFEREHIERHTDWPLFQQTKRWNAGNLERLELRRPQKKYKTKTMKDMVDEREEGENLELVFVTHNNIDLCTIAPLTEGEARWMAHGILTHRWSWFGESAGSESFVDGTPAP